VRTSRQLIRRGERLSSQPEMVGAILRFELAAA
jgi:hypothetical protein